MTSSPEPTAWVLPDHAGQPMPGGGAESVFPGSAPPAVVEDWSLPELPDRADGPALPARSEADEAYERGFTEGGRQGAARAEERLRGALEALAGVAARLHEAQEEFARERARHLECLALAVARKLVQRELRADATLVRDLVTRALDLLPLDTSLEVRLHPTDLTELGPGLEQVAPAGRAIALQWIPDPTLERGSFVVETPHRVVDGRTDVALRALYERLDDE